MNILRKNIKIILVKSISLGQLCHEKTFQNVDHTLIVSIKNKSIRKEKDKEKFLLLIDVRRFSYKTIEVTHTKESL